MLSEMLGESMRLSDADWTARLLHLHTERLIGEDVD